jgi:hypothetical protein
VYPYKFLLRHYPIRSQAHGERKVFRERQSRFLPEARDRGWHRQYDAIQAGHSFLRAPESLEEFAEESFLEDYVVERLSGVGLDRVALGPRRQAKGREGARPGAAGQRRGAGGRGKPSGG